MRPALVDIYLLIRTLMFAHIRPFSPVTLSRFLRRDKPNTDSCVLQDLKSVLRWTAAVPPTLLILVTVFIVRLEISSTVCTVWATSFLLL